MNQYCIFMYIIFEILLLFNLKHQVLKFLPLEFIIVIWMLLFDVILLLARFSPSYGFDFVSFWVHYSILLIKKYRVHYYVIIHVSNLAILTLSL